MKTEKNLKTNDPQPVIEDLTVNEGQAAEVKGGDARPFYLKAVGGGTISPTNS